MTVFLGFDCGGTSCRALALDEDGSVLHSGHAGPGNIATTPDYHLRKHLHQAANGCPRPDAVCGCFAGLLTEDDRARAVSILAGMFPGATCRAEPDYHAALMSCPPGTHACLVVGTGSVICSRVEGRLVKSGGRGFLLGDAGSTAQYGRDALLHFLAVGPANTGAKLRDRIQSLFGSLDESDIVSRLYRHPTPVSLLVRLASSLAHDYKAGEPYAVAGVERHTSLLADVVAEHCRRFLADEPFIKLVLAGGLWKLGEVFGANLEQGLCQRLEPKRVECTRISKPPVVGAAMLAEESL